MSSPVTPPTPRTRPRGYANIESVECKSEPEVAVGGGWHGSQTAGRDGRSADDAGCGRRHLSRSRRVRLLGDGLPNAEIGDRLFVSVRTVEAHVSSLLAKLGARNRGQLTANQHDDRFGDHHVEAVVPRMCARGVRRTIEP